MDQASLIEQLRIERAPEPPRRRTAVWWSASLAVGRSRRGAALYVGLPRAVSIQVAVAQPVSDAASVGPSSILDASGYVVARRQATVSAKITGKVVAVGIEEGQRVERDQIIARLDDTNAKASVAHARAELEQARATLIAAEVAFANAKPTFQRNEQQLARAVISAQTFDTAKTASTRRGPSSKSPPRRRGRRGAPRARRAQSRRHRRACPVRGHRDRQSRAGRRDGLADLGRRRVHADGHRHDRGHVVARGRGRRQRKLHQSCRAATSRRP